MTSAFRFAWVAAGVVAGCATPAPPTQMTAPFNASDVAWSRVAGTATVEGHAISAESLTALVRSRNPARLAVTIAGADDASLQHLMLVIDAIRTGGATQIGLAARQTSR